MRYKALLVVAVFAFGIIIGYLFNGASGANDIVVCPGSELVLYTDFEPERPKHAVFAEEQLPAGYYEQTSYVVWHKVFSVSGNYFEYPQIFGLHDKLIERNANDKLSWIFRSDVIPFDKWAAHPPRVVYQSNRFLCVQNNYSLYNPNSGGGRTAYCTIWQTISIDTGELLHLNDILEIDDSFVEQLMESPTAIRSIKEYFMQIEPWSEADDEQVNQYIKSEYSPEEVKDFLMSACADYTDENYYSKCSFYLTPNAINIVKNNDYTISSWFNIRLELDDIERFLKVDKW